MVELSVIGISLQGEEAIPIALLHPHGSHRILSLRISAMEAFAISTALHSEDGIARTVGKTDIYEDVTGRKNTASIFPKPLVHDFLLNSILALGGRLLSVDILSLVEGACVAEAVIGSPKGDLRVDCRPADGIAIALRCGAILRATNLALAEAQDMDTVMAGLPEHVRTIAAARLSALPASRRVQSLVRLPESVEIALSEKVRRMRENPGEELISVARKMLHDESVENTPSIEEMEEIFTALEARRRIKADDDFSVKANSPKVSVKVGGVELATKPQIRVVSVQRSNKGNAEILDESQLPGKGITEEVLASLGLSQSEADAVKGAPGNDRWATLLRILAPETKVPM